MTESAEFMAETFGVKVDNNGNYAVIDSLAGLSEDQRKEYGNLPLEAKYQYKHNVLESIYTKDYFNAAKSNDAKEQAIFDEMSMQVKVLSPGYLNMLSDDERTQLINDYLSWDETHTKGVFGYTDEEFDALSEEEQAAAKDKSASLMSKWAEANKDYYSVWQKDNPEAPTTNTDAPEANADAPETDSNTASKTDSPWAAVVGYAGAVILAAKKFIDEHAIPWFKEHVLQSEEEMKKDLQADTEETAETKAETESEAKTDEQVSNREIPTDTMGIPTETGDMEME